MLSLCSHGFIISNNFQASIFSISHSKVDSNFCWWAQKFSSSNFFKFPPMFVFVYLSVSLFVTHKFTWIEFGKNRRVKYSHGIRVIKFL